MAESQSGYVKSQTLITAVCIAFVVGFLLGILLTIYKTGGPVQEQAALSPERSKMAVALEAEVKKNPANVAAWIQLGNIRFDNNRYAEAISAYEKATRLDPTNADVLTDLGVMYRRNGEPKKALDAFERAIQADPRHEVAHFNKGIVLLHDLDDLEGAIAAWESLVKLNPQATTPSGQPVAELIRHYRAESQQAPASPEKK